MSIKNPSKHSISAKPKAVQPIGKVVCVGRNYAAHIAELGNEVPVLPLLFIKPASSVVFFDAPIPSVFYKTAKNSALNNAPLPVEGYDVHYETELCIRLGKDLSNAGVEEVRQTQGLIDAVTLGLDLTLRELQTKLKDLGHPWERAKSFDGACVLGDWIDSEAYADFSTVSFQLFINQKLAQDGNTKNMILPVYDLLSEMSYAFSLQAGDVIMTGTPAGVGRLSAGENLMLKLGEHEWSTQVI